MILAALISYPRAVVLGLVQGVAEPFPISSLGHAVILPRLLGWNIHQNDPYFVAFLVATHLATALVLLAFFRRDWVRILRGLGRSLRDRGIDPEDTDARLGWLLVVGTIPAGIIGLLFQDALRKAFASGSIAAGSIMSAVRTRSPGPDATESRAGSRTTAVTSCPAASACCTRHAPTPPVAPKMVSFIVLSCLPLTRSRVHWL